MPKHRTAIQLYLSDRDLAARYNVNRASIWRWSAARKFPTPIKVGPRMTRWCLKDIEAYEAQSAGTDAA